MGREPREATRYDRDARGLVVATLTEREPEWTDADRGWLLALRAEEADVCPGCGNPVDLCRDPATEKTWTLITQICQACLVLDADRHNQAESKRPPLGRYTAAVRREP